MKIVDCVAALASEKELYHDPDCPRMAVCQGRDRADYRRNKGKVF